MNLKELGIAIIVVGIIGVFIGPFIRLFISKQHLKTTWGRGPDPMQEELWENLEDNHHADQEHRLSSRPEQEEPQSPDLMWTFYREDKPD